MFVVMVIGVSANVAAAVQQQDLLIPLRRDPLG
jgi:hypothetical protein